MSWAIKILWKSAFENEFFFWYHGIFFVHFDSKNGCENEFQDNNEKSCRWFKSRILQKIDLRAVGTHESHPTPWELRNGRKINGTIIFRRPEYCYILCAHIMTFLAGILPFYLKLLSEVASQPSAPRFFIFDLRFTNKFVTSELNNVFGPELAAWPVARLIIKIVYFLLMV